MASLLFGKPTFYMKIISYAFDLTSYCLYSCQATKNQQPMGTKFFARNGG